MTPCNRSFPRGISSFLEMLATTYNRLDAEDPNFTHHNHYSDSKRITHTRAKFAASEYSNLIGTLTREARNKESTYDEFIQMITDEIHFAEDGYSTRARAKAQVALAEPETLQAFAYRTRSLRDDDDDTWENPGDASLRRYINNVGIRMYNDPDFNIGKKAYRLLMQINPELVRQFREARAAEIAKARQDRTNPDTNGPWRRNPVGPPREIIPTHDSSTELKKNPDWNKGEVTMPRQYSRPMANTATVDNDEDESVSLESESSPLNVTNNARGLISFAQTFEVNSNINPQSHKHQTT